jgi:hypothetical protein
MGKPLRGRALLASLTEPAEKPSHPIRVTITLLAYGAAAPPWRDGHQNSQHNNCHIEIEGAQFCLWG